MTEDEESAGPKLGESQREVAERECVLRWSPGLIQGPNSLGFQYAATEYSSPLRRDAGPAR